MTTRDHTPPTLADKLAQAAADCYAQDLADAALPDGELLERARRKARTHQTLTPAELRLLRIESDEAAGRCWACKRQLCADGLCVCMTVG